MHPLAAPVMGCNLRDLAEAEDTTMDAMKGKRVGIDSFLLAFQFNPMFLKFFLKNHYLM
mgnify:CR=1 FL=1